MGCPHYTRTGDGASVWFLANLNIVRGTRGTGREHVVTYSCCWFVVTSPYYFLKYCNLLFQRPCPHRGTTEKHFSPGKRSRQVICSRARQRNMKTWSQDAGFKTRQIPVLKMARCFPLKMEVLEGETSKTEDFPCLVTRWQNFMG